MTDVSATKGSARPRRATAGVFAGTAMALFGAAAGADEAPADADPRAIEPTVESADGARRPAVDAGEDVVVTADRYRILPTDPSATSFGFAKPLDETPRAVSMISKEAIDLYGLSAVEDLVRVVPGVFTTTRFGIQGGIDIRGVPADTYYRGMKRVNLQGHGRSVLAAMDSIEIVKGPPSPIFGMGKIGGYTNMTPKSGRAAEGGYLPGLEGFAQAIVGSYQRREASFGLGGPLAVAGKRGGYYVYGLYEDSDSYAENVPVKQKLVQAATTVDEFMGRARLETGFNYQVSETAGSLTNRVTQALVDSGRYVTGRPLANLDLNGNGRIGYLEYQRASPVRGALSAANQPLSQRFSWPTDASGRPLPLDAFPRVAGIPVTMYNALVAQCGGVTGTNAACADPTGRLRAAGPGGPVPQGSGANGRQLPVGFVLDPRTVGFATLDPRRTGAFEKEVEAEFVTAFLDLVYDEDPDFTIKNQLFFDSIDQLKLSEQPGGGKQDVYLVENKLTVTRRIGGLPGWLAVNSLASANYRETRATGYRYGGDFSTNRTDVMTDGVMTPNTTFVHSFDNPDLNADGAPWTSDYRSDYWESGIGLMFDVDLYDRLNLIVGGRYDYSEARNVNWAGTFNPTVGTAANPGRFVTADTVTEGSDDGVSYSASLTWKAPFGVKPYLTFARSSLTLESNNNSLDPAVITAGHIGEAELKEAGIKATLFGDRLYVATAVYEQTRTDVRVQDDPTLGAEVSSSITKGWETEVKWAPTRNLVLSAYALFQESEYLFDTGGNIMVDARTLGFQDVLDASGNVLYPAEAFLYGGRAFLVLPPGLPEYRTRQGNPERQFGLNASYEFGDGFGLTLSGNRFSSTYSGRLQLIELPAATIANVGAFYEFGATRVKLDVFNATDERYFRARSGDTLGDAMFSPMPDRRFQLTLTSSFK